MPSNVLCNMHNSPGFCYSPTCGHGHYVCCKPDAGLGRQMLHRWGYDRDEQAEIAEQLHQLATEQEEEDDWSD